MFQNGLKKAEQSIHRPFGFDKKSIFHSLKLVVIRHSI
jgi:hypothetical protein